ncbi:MAG: alpha/beta hydrolase family protein [Acidimicrobiales bacterium]
MSAAPRVEFVGLASPVVGRAGAGGHPCQGLYHRPAQGEPTTAFIATHYNVDFSEHYLASFLAERGFGFLGWNTRFRGGEMYFLLDHAIAEIAVGVRWLREVAKVDRVVLLGNSGGGSLMAAYQSQAVAPELRPEYGRSSVLEAAQDVPACDLYVSLAAHTGRPEVLTGWLDPSVTDEFDSLSVDPALDPYDPANGSPFTPEFLTRYRAAQVARNQRITQWCKDELERLGAAGARDRLFATPRLWADPRMIDPTLDPSNRPARSCYLGDPKAANYGIYGVGTVSSLRTWLSMWSLEESQCNGGPHLAKVTIPSLVIDADADSGVFPSDTAQIVADLGAKDLTTHTIGADHYLREVAGARDEAADLISEWTTARA